MKESVLLFLLLFPLQSFAAPTLHCFGRGGQVKMLYDNRQRPQAVYLHGKVYIVFNAGADQAAGKKPRTRPLAVTYDVKTRQLSDIVTLGPRSSDHHDGPVIWADTQERLHVFYGWHLDLGKHLFSHEPRSLGAGVQDWRPAPVPAPKMSYPWVSRIYDDQQLVFYRTNQHYSAWTYRITPDNGNTWQGPSQDVIDLDVKGGMDTDWSVYAAKAVSRDGDFLHIGFIAYDDFKRPRSPQEIAGGQLDERRQQNPLYHRRTRNYKYNLYYVKVNLRTGAVTNHQGERLETPIDRTTANTRCMIWDTQWRGGGIVPGLWVNQDDQVSFLHNISDFTSPESLAYYYVRYDNGTWRQTRITRSNHHWNSGYLTAGPDGSLHAYVITGPGYLDSDGYMDRYGGGSIEEWTSRDRGDTWQQKRDLTPDRAKYPGWKYNNIQSVKRPDGSVIEGMLLFYGWKDRDAPEARAFLLHQ